MPVIGLKLSMAILKPWNIFRWSAYRIFKIVQRRMIHHLLQMRRVFSNCMLFEVYLPGRKEPSWLMSFGSNGRLPCNGKLVALAMKPRELSSVWILRKWKGEAKKNVKSALWFQKPKQTVYNFLTFEAAATMISSSGCVLAPSVVCVTVAKIIITTSNLLLKCSDHHILWILLRWENASAQTFIFFIGWILVAYYWLSHGISRHGFLVFMICLF